MPPPTAQEALRANEIQEKYEIHARKTKEGWVAEDGKGQRRKAAGIHATPHAALLAAEVAIQAGEEKARAERCRDVIDTLQSANYYAVPKDLPEEGGRVWNIVRLDSSPTSVAGRPSVMVALEDAAAASKRGDL